MHHYIHTVLCPTVIDECPIVLKDAVKESDPVDVILGDLVNIISLILINSSQSLVVISLPLFEHHNPEIDCHTQVINESQKSSALKSLIPT